MDGGGMKGLQKRCRVIRMVGNLREASGNLTDGVGVGARSHGKAVLFGQPPGGLVQGPGMEAAVEHLHHIHQA